jgi:hypothetical protein
VAACSLAALIVANEAGIDLDLIKVDIYHTPHTLPAGSDTPRSHDHLWQHSLASRNDSRKAADLILR